MRQLGMSQEQQRAHLEALSSMFDVAEEPLEWIVVTSVSTTTLQQAWSGLNGIDIAGWSRTIINALQVAVAVKSGNCKPLTA
jgi:hypothetical protein